MKKFGTKLAAAGRTRTASVLFVLFAPLLSLWVMEGLHRGSFVNEDFTTALTDHLPSFLLSWLLLVLFYALLKQLFGRHWPAMLITGFLCCVTGLACWYKLQMRGEPLLPWDFSQLGELAGVASKLKLQIPPTLWLALAILTVLLVLSVFVRPPRQKAGLRFGLAGGCAAALCALVLGVFLQPTVTQKCGIYSDMWMQDRYYRNYGVITGFLTNLTVLKIDEPDGYSQEAVEAVEQQVQTAAETQEPLYEDSYAAKTADPVKQPNIIYMMDESFWDLDRLDGITFDRQLTPNLAALKQEAAHGYSYSPSFGGGTCDVEFEALTGFSLEHLPAGAKPYQQYVTHDMFSLPQYLKSEGYQTLAIHGYYATYWSRNVAYPHLGIDEFLAAEDFVNPDTRRGFISDDAMVDRIIEEYKTRSASDAPLFIHAVTMQNHTTYSADRYNADELVKIVSDPGFSAETRSQLQDFATGVYETDAALGKLVDYLRTVDEPTILVFWGDHFNPVGENYELYTKTGWIEPGQTNSPALHGTDLLIWSNYDATSIDLGTIGAYNISPVMMDLYGLDKPLYFSYLSQQLPLMRARTRGVTVEPDGTYSETMTDEQQQAFNTQWLLQYDLMFGKPYLEDYTQSK